MLAVLLKENRLYLCCWSFGKYLQHLSGQYTSIWSRKGNIRESEFVITWICCQTCKLECGYHCIHSFCLMHDVIYRALYFETSVWSSLGNGLKSTKHEKLGQGLKNKLGCFIVGLLCYMIQDNLKSTLACLWISKCYAQMEIHLWVYRIERQSSSPRRSSIFPPIVLIPNYSFVRKFRSHVHVERGSSFII